MATLAVVSESKSKMQKAVEVLQDDLKAFRGGRATPALVEHIKVEYYGSPKVTQRISGLGSVRSLGK